VESVGLRDSGSRLLLFIGAVLIASAGALLSARDTALAVTCPENPTEDHGCWLEHGHVGNLGYGSIIPYFSGGQVNIQNFTQYDDRVSAAIDGGDNTSIDNYQGPPIPGWNDALPRAYLVDGNDSLPTYGYVVATGSQADDDLLYATNKNCEYLFYNGAGSTSQAFAMGIGPEGYDALVTVVCLNHSHDIACNPCFDTSFDSDPGKEVRAIAHEFGHNLHLHHGAGGIMSSSWPSYNPDSTRADLIQFNYVTCPRKLVQS
jgi:hypothetical protein